MMKESSYNSQVFLLIVFFGNFLCVHNDTTYSQRLLIFAVVESKSHTLPYFLTSLRNINYDKNITDVVINVDDKHNDTTNILNTWVTMYGHIYNSVTIQHNITTISPSSREQNFDKADAIHKRNRRIIEEREFIFTLGIRTHDYLLMLDSDVFLTEPDVLNVLIARRYAVVAPMLVSDDTYSNFWLSPSEQLGEEDMTTYTRLVNREHKYLGCAEPPYISSAVLISLNHPLVKYLTYDPDKIRNFNGPETDIAAFAESARRAGIRFRLCNDLFYGYIVAPADSTSGSEQKLTNLKMHAIHRGIPVPLDNSMQSFVSYPKTSTLYCTKIFMINLDRRPERKMLMMANFMELGMEVTRVPAIDGSELVQSTIKALNIKLMDNYEDPYHKRPMKAGEVGCFLSHYEIWTKVVRNQFRLTMVLEDDVMFTPGFRDSVVDLLGELRNTSFDFLYLGRKILMEAEEEKVTAHTTRPLYSYWTIGYVITYQGAVKLLKAKPLQNILPVDEFIPIMFDSHPNSTWKSHFPERNLIALSASPLLVFPTHYVGMPGYSPVRAEASDRRAHIRRATLLLALNFVVLCFMLI